MAMKDEDIAKIVEKTKGKKAKMKPCPEAPTETKETKLPSDVRKGLEKHFGASLGKVRVHVAGNAKEMCKQLKAKAFTIGNDIYLAKPASAKDGHLLAHELTHVLQQGGGKMPKPKAGKALVSK
jgi:uncharacterized protein DUF4157